MVPTGIQGKLVEIAPEGNYTIIEKSLLLKVQTAKKQT